MDQIITETATPTQAAEQPVKQTVETPVEDVEVLRNKITELQAQKEHWRGKYERDITSPQKIEPVPSDDVYSDEGKLLRGEISTLASELKSIKQKEERREVESEFSVLKDKKEDFDAFLEDDENKRLSIKKAAKLFLAEKGLLEVQVDRKGLEKPTSGGQTPPDPTKSEEELEHLRKTNYREYEKLIRAGKV